MDTYENEPNFNKSVFKNLNKAFWCKEISWANAKMIFSYRLDAWHLSKSAMILCIVGSILSFEMKHEWWVHLISFGLIWNFTFWLFYIKIFRIK
jgi:hypothetical protein